MLYTGIDIVEIERIERAIQRWGERFLQRVFTTTELRDAGGRPRSLAARWAAKEAAAKALGVGLSGPGAAAAVGAGVALRWHEIEVRRPAGQPPQLLLHGAAARRAAALGWRVVALSLSHGRQFAVALVVAQAADQGGQHG
ncbi:holo-ACP synthase [Kallotenue papyrolyticum]|uniref:holo-ACP synthase n=1 Tax=Kallotenue papyrolyticum TaxID=1325125 RepID=UPI0004785D36